MNSELVETFVHRASQSGATCVVIEEPHGLQEPIQTILREEDRIFCPQLTSLERTITIPAGRRSTEVTAASAAIEEVAWGIADTGTIVCIGSIRERLQASLFPEHHIALLRESGIRKTFLDVMRMLTDLPRNITLITGPSRTADIEKTLVLGMHGPRRLTILVIKDDDHGMQSSHCEGSFSNPRG